MFHWKSGPNPINWFEHVFLSYLFRNDGEMVVFAHWCTDFWKINFHLGSNRTSKGHKHQRTHMSSPLSSFATTRRTSLAENKQSPCFDLSEIINEILWPCNVSFVLPSIIANVWKNESMRLINYFASSQEVPPSVSPFHVAEIQLHAQTTVSHAPRFWQLAQSTSF